MKNFATIKEQIIDLVNPVLKKHHLKIYEVNNFSAFGDDILQILVEDENQSRKPLDLDFLVKVSEDVSHKLDDIDHVIPTNYLLEVASAGIEKAIRSEAELKQAVGEYVFVELKKEKNKIKEFNGIVESYADESQEFFFSYFVKGQKKKIALTFTEIKLVRYAVKF